MTINEAIKFAKENVLAYTSEMAEFKVLAIEALERQTPKIPNFEGDGYADGELVYDTWICPCCGKEYEVDYDDYKYCPECGQAIDWRINRQLYVEE